MPDPKNWKLRHKEGTWYLYETEQGVFVSWHHCLYTNRRARLNETGCEYCNETQPDIIAVVRELQNWNAR